jgi:uncharacterized protein YxeA
MTIGIIIIIGIIVIILLVLFVYYTSSGGELETSSSMVSRRTQRQRVTHDGERGILGEEVPPMRVPDQYLLNPEYAAYDMKPK